MDRPPIIMTNTLLFALSGLTALIAVPWYGLSQGYDLWQWLCFLLLFCYCGISITAGYHRLWSHKAYKAHPLLQWIFGTNRCHLHYNSKPTNDDSKGSARIGTTPAALLMHQQLRLRGGVHIAEIHKK